MRRVVAPAAALVAVLLLAGCTEDSAPAPLGDPKVATYTDLRVDYLAAMCPVNAWLATGADAAAKQDRAAQGQRIAAAAAGRLDVAPERWPAQVKAPVADLVSGLDRLRDYYAAAGSGAADQPPAVGTAAQRTIESIVYVSAAAGSDNCTGRVPTPSATPAG